MGDLYLYSLELEFVAVFTGQILTNLRSKKLQFLQTFLAFFIIENDAAALPLQRKWY